MQFEYLSISVVSYTFEQCWAIKEINLEDVSRTTRHYFMNDESLIAKEQLYIENRMENVSNVACIQKMPSFNRLSAFKMITLLEYAAYSFVYLVKHRNRVKHLHRLNTQWRTTKLRPLKEVDVQRRDEYWCHFHLKPKESRRLLVTNAKTASWDQWNHEI